MKALVTLTPQESKRIIARSIAGFGLVKGVSGFACAHRRDVPEEITGERIDIDQCCFGFMHENGSCYVLDDLQPQGQLVLEKGRVRWLDTRVENILDFIHGMDSRHVLIKSGNLFDPECGNR